ncbi:MAG: hypothetical protein HRU18_28080 [Pseudoalteromonas sp.]|uniref:hypothetical protein n=1 Tax=Pseudoalteromonas sp. TaxID=53249 RepID=UPI001E117605|nr:hypothetical protein [Pseudoalteromonas sp.]NRA82070.1 hypothetical protein [Pseudoalteromonas sp.]
MITEQTLHEAREKIEGRYQDQLREWAKGNLERMVHDFCFKYGMNFITGMGTWSWKTARGNVSHDPYIDFNHYAVLLEELVCDCEEFRQDAHADIQRTISQCGFEGMAEFKAWLEEGKKIGYLLDQSADRVSCWGEYVEPFKYERFPEHVK